MANGNYNAIVPDEQPGLRTFVDGKEDGPVVVFVHGWPDDHALWDKQASVFLSAPEPDASEKGRKKFKAPFSCFFCRHPIGYNSPYYRMPDPRGGVNKWNGQSKVVYLHGDGKNCVGKIQVAHLKDRFKCITTDLPGFSGDDAHVEKWGYSTDEVVKRIERTVERAGNGQPIILVAHDFGCMYSFKFEAKRPDLVRKMVAIDVGGAMKPSVCGAMLMVTYQLWLCLAFVVGRPIGDGIARSFAWLLGSPSGGRIARAATCYPYYHTWKSLLCSGEKVKPMMPQCPLMFLHGTAGVKKVMTFHADRWAEKVQEREGSSSQGIPQASHWVTRDQPDEVNRRLDEFLADVM